MISRLLLFIGILSGLALQGCASREGGASSPLDGGDPAIRSRDSSLTAVTDRYGPLVVRQGTFSADSQVRPWSSWWFPYWDSSLFEGIGGKPGALQKYDQLAAKRGLPADASRYEREHFYDPDAPDGRNRTGGWALASLLEREPPSKRSIDGVQFSRGDLKALLIESYSATPVDVYGQVYGGKPGDQIDDLAPDQFHKFLEVVLLQGRRPFVLDEDAGVPIWADPIYKARVTLKADADDQSLFHVQADLWSVEVRGPKDYDKEGSDEKKIHYTYDLKGHLLVDGSLKVSYGEWTNEYQADHPDFVVELPASPGREGLNPRLDPKLIGQIVL
jgi:hypothetical protein